MKFRCFCLDAGQLGDGAGDVGGAGRVQGRGRGHGRHQRVQVGVVQQVARSSSFYVMSYWHNQAECHFRP